LALAKNHGQYFVFVIRFHITTPELWCYTTEQNLFRECKTNIYTYIQKIRKDTKSTEQSGPHYI